MKSKLARTLRLTSLLFYFVAALPPQPITNNTTLSLPAISITNDHKSPLNNDIPLISCSGSRYRTGLNLQSCRDAANQIPSDDGQLRKFGRYIESGRNGNVHLPFRFISSDGLCTIDIVLQDHYTETTASYAELWRAASNLVRRCVAPSGVGGIAMNVGFSGTMGLILTSYLPIVQCHPSEPAPSLASCFILTQTMTSSVMPRTFGNPDDPEAYVKLPRYLVEPSRQCVAVVLTTGLTDVSSFYEIWEAVVAVNGMCVRSGHSGTAFLRGRNRQLFVEVGSGTGRLDRP